MPLKTPFQRDGVRYYPGEILLSEKSGKVLGQRFSAYRNKKPTISTEVPGTNIHRTDVINAFVDLLERSNQREQKKYRKKICPELN